MSKRCKQGQKKGNKLKPVNRKNLCALLIIDLDGTVLRTDKTISLRFKEAAREASNKGIKLVFASGRTLENLIDFVTELEFLPNDNYIIACNGALIWEQKSKQILRTDMLVHKDILYIKEFASQICSPCFLINNRTLHSPFNYSASNDIRKYTTLPVTWGSFNWQDKKIVTPKMMFIASSKEIDSIQAKIPQSLREHYNFVRSEPNYLEVMKKNVHKGAACQFLAKYLKISSSQIIAIGDEYNDVEMLKYAGLGIAMQNAREEIKAIADWVTLSNDCDGVAYAIEKWILNSE